MRIQLCAGSVVLGMVCVGMRRDVCIAFVVFAHMSVSERSWRMFMH